ncbi:MAG: V-type ATP synthase subunit D [Candidatus Competibacteraceae bacterium]|nr:V-type ATP synthase subunit D [Candidatus Competibacteraceae bacterium]
MARQALNKATLQRQTRQLATYERFLPSLDLKRRQLISARSGALGELAALREQLTQLRRQVTDGLPMLANRRVELEGLVTLTGVDLGEENLLGVRLPVLVGVQSETHPYGLLVRPHWVDRVARLLGLALELRVREQIQLQRLERLEAAVVKITQRVNLFDKVLIPRTQAHIRRIRIHLADAERAAVVRAKLAKARGGNPLSPEGGGPSAPALSKGGR